MSQKKTPIPTPSSRYKEINSQGSVAETSQGRKMSATDMKNVVVSPDGSIFVKTLVHVDPDSDLFLKVAQSAYADHERSLVQCVKCKRKFFPDRIEKHQANCAAEKLQLQQSTKSQPFRQQK